MVDIGKIANELKDTHKVKSFVLVVLDENSVVAAMNVHEASLTDKTNIVNIMADCVANIMKSVRDYRR